LDRMKRGRDTGDDRGQDGGLQSRLINLIARIGDNDTATQLTHHLEGLASVLQSNMQFHRHLIIDTILECARSIHSKSTTYATLVGLLNSLDGEIGLMITEGAQRELQGALEDHAPMAIRGLTRFIVGLMSAHVVTTPSVVEMLRCLLHAHAISVPRAEDIEPPPLARADWFAVVVMDALVLCGKELALVAPKELANLLSFIELQAAARIPLRDRATLLMPFGASTTSAELIEHFDALYTIVLTFREDGGWSSPVLLAPHRAFATSLLAAPKHALGTITVPPHSLGCTYPTFHRLRLLPAPRSADAMLADEEAQEDEMGRDLRQELRHVGHIGGVASEALATTERLLLEEHVCLLVGAFADSHKDCAKLMHAMSEEMGVECASLFVEVMLSFVLALPAPKYKQTYYALVLIDLCKGIPAVPVALEAAVNRLFESLPRMDAELVERLAQWLAFHVSNFDFSLEPFARPWGDALATVSRNNEALTARPEDCPTLLAFAEASGARARFVRMTLDHMVRLSYLERVTRRLPQQFHPYLPGRFVGVLDRALASCSCGEADHTATVSAAALSSALLAKLRAKVPDDQVIGWLNDALPVDSELRVSLIVQTLLHAGAKSISHLEKLLDKFGWLLLHFAHTPEERVEVLSAVSRYWQACPQMCALLIAKLCKHRVVDSSAIFAFAFHADGRGKLDHAGWEIVNEHIWAIIYHQRDVAALVRSKQHRLEDVMSRCTDDAGVRHAEAEVASARAALDDARRQKKGVFADLFAHACGLLGARNTRSEVALAEQQEWRQLVLSRLLALGRLHAGEYSLDTVELVVEGNDVAHSVRDAVFPPLRTVQCFLS